jgi:Arc/MetJ-type ribon-helix-helix transcriptional regulator
MATPVTRIETLLPAALVAEMEALVEAGWFRDRDTLLADALRRYLESHRPQLMERFVREDVDWGLRGRD